MVGSVITVRERLGRLQLQGYHSLTLTKIQLLDLTKLGDITYVYQLCLVKFQTFKHRDKAYLVKIGLVEYQVLEKMI